MFRGAGTLLQQFSHTARGIVDSYSNTVTKPGGLIHSYNNTVTKSGWLVHSYNNTVTKPGGLVHSYNNTVTKTREWPTPWTQSLVIALPKKGNLQQYQNYRTINLISHPSKVMLKIILTRVKPQAEKIIAEEQPGFRAGRRTTE